MAPGAILGDRYRIERRLGRGGMGDVWLAFDLKLRVEVALKTLRTDFFEDEDHRELLRREVRSARDVHSPNVCRVFDLIEFESQELVSMEYIDGSTLLQILENRGPLGLREAREIAAQFLAGLEAIHQAGLVHRDLKPENLMITRAGRVVVMDFGIAKSVPQSGSEAATLVGRDPGSGGGGGRSRGNTVAGTPAYMAPEQMRGDAVDARSDVFSAGIILAEMVSRASIADHKTRETIWAGIRRDPIELPDTPWEPVLRRCVAAEPSQRYDSAHSLSRALEEITLRVEDAEDRSPYPGLSAFTEQNAEYFFGREAEVEEIWRKLQSLQMLAVIGPSGVGKSSFLRAGVIPVRPEAWEIVICTPGSSPLSALAQALAPQLAGDAEAVQELVRFEDPGSALSAARRWRKRHGEVLLILDQFEELFTQNSPETQLRFTELLGRLALESDVHLLLSMRDDFFFRCHEFAALAPVFSEPRPLGPLTGAALRRALVQPSLLCGYRFEEETLVEEMVGQLGETRGALPLMAFAAAQLWEHRDRTEGLLTRSAYEKIGGVGGALAKHAEATLEKIGDQHQGLVREMFRNLITSEGTRRSVDTEELLSVFEDRRAASEILEQLIEARLLTSFEIESEGERRRRVEVVHETLLSSWPRLVRWQTQDADGAQLRDQLRQAAGLWSDRHRSQDLLWTGTAFEEYRLWRDRYPGGLSRVEEEFGQAMVARQAQRRRRRRIATLAAFTALIAVVLVIGISREQALEQARRAEANGLLAFGREVLDVDPTWSLACAIASLERLDSPDARKFALEALGRGPTRFVLPASMGGWSVDFSPDGRWLAQGRHSGEVWVWSRDGGEPIILPGLKDVPQTTSFHPHRPWLMAASQDTLNSVRVWSIPDGELIFAPDLPRQSDAGWADDGRALLTATDDGDGSIIWRSWSVEDWEPTVLGTGGTYRSHHNRRTDQRGRRFLDWTDDDELRVYALDRLHDERPYWRVGRLENGLKSACLDASGEQVVVCDGTGEISLWSSTSESGEPIRVLGTHAAAEFVRSGPRGHFIGTSGDEGNAYIWNLEAPPRADAVVLRRDAGTVNDVAFHPDGIWVAMVTQSGWMSLWPTTHEYPWVLRGHREGVRRGVALDPQGEWIVSASGDKTVRVWNLAHELGESSWVHEYPDFYDLFDLDIDGRGERIILGGPRGDHPTGVSLISRETGEETPISPLTDFGVISAVALGPRGRFAAASGTWGVNGPITVWDLEEDQSFLLDRGDSVTVLDLQFLPDGRLIEAGRSGLHLWKLEDRTCSTVIDSECWDVDLSGDGSLALSVGRGGTLLHDLSTGRTTELPAHQGQMRGAIDPTGRWVVTGNTISGEIRFGAVGSDEVHLLLGHESGVTSLSFDPLGRWVLSSGDDGTIRLWPIPKGPSFHTLPIEEFLGRLRALTNIRIVPDEENPGKWTGTYEPFTGWNGEPTW